jgi:predicted esterase
MGMKMPAWYDIRHLNPDAREDVDGLNDTRRIIAELVDAEIKAGTPSDKIILGGFSQGGASAIWSGFSESRKLAGILGLSCYVPSAKTFPEIVREENKSTPILMLHGDSDEVVRYSWGQQSFALLKELGLNGTFKAYKGALRYLAKDYPFFLFSFPFLLS